MTPAKTAGTTTIPTTPPTPAAVRPSTGDRARCLLVVLACAAVPLLVPAPTAAWQALSPAGSLDPTGPLLATVALVAWALTGWTVLAVLLTLGGRLPGLLGRAAGAVAARTVPGALRRTVEVALGAGLVLGTVGGVGSTGGVSAWADPGVDTAPVTSSVTSSVTVPAAVGLDWPVTAPAAPAATTRATTHRPATPPASSAPVPVSTTSPDPTGCVVVAPGDTLWDLAERSLRAAGDATPTARAVASTWPSWWQANREAVGDDPDLLRPGTRLAPPPPA